MKCFGVNVEVEFFPVYESQPLFSDVDRFLRDRGFMLFDLSPVYWKRKVGLQYGSPKGQIIWADAVYFKQPSVFFESMRTSGNSYKLSKTFRAIITLVLYGYLDFALEIIEQAGCTIGENRPDINNQLEELQRLLKKRRLSGLIPRFRYRNKIAGLFRYFYKMFRVGCEEHSVREGNLGNV